MAWSLHQATVVILDAHVFRTIENVQHITEEWLFV